MLTLRSTKFTGQPTQLATAFITERADHFVVAISLSGPHALVAAHQIQDKLNQTEVNTPASFLSLLERVQELWTGLFGELSAVYAHEGKIYLMCKNGEIWLHRGEKFGRVLKSSDELRVVEGRVQNLDQYFVLTQSSSVAVSELFTYMSEGKVAVEQVMASIQPKIDSSGLTDRCALAIIETHVEVLPEELTPSTPIQSNQEVMTETPSVPLPPTVSKSVVVTDQLKKLAGLVHKATPILKASSVKTIALFKRLPELKEKKISAGLRKKIAVALIVLVMIGIVFVIAAVWRSSQVRKGQAFLLPFQQRLTTIQQIPTDDSVSARDQVLILQKEFESQRVPFDKNIFVKSDVISFSNQLAGFVKEVSGKVELQTLPIFYDFRLVRADFIASKADTDGGLGTFVDLERQVAISLTMDTKQQTVLPIGQYPTLKDLSLSGDQLYVLADGVYRFPIDSKKSAEKIIDEGDSNRDGKFLRVFGEFVYVLNLEKRNLYRYVIAKTGGETPQPVGWFQDKKDLDFPSITSFAIDGNVWLGTQQGHILRYERGNPVAYNVQGLQEPFSTPVKIYTKEDLDSVFVLESAKNRVVRLSKDGVFIKQIQSPSLGAATDIIFSSKTGKAYALAGSLVYELAL